MVTKEEPLPCIAEGSVLITYYFLKIMEHMFLEHIL